MGRSREPVEPRVWFDRQEVDGEEVLSIYRIGGRERQLRDAESRMAASDRARDDITSMRYYGKRAGVIAGVFDGGEAGPENIGPIVCPFCAMVPCECD